MENIKVVVRVKPLSEEEKEEGSENVIRLHPDGKTLQVTVPAEHCEGATEPPTPAKTPNRSATPRKGQTPRSDKNASRTVNQLKTFSFDSVYGPEVAQREIFKDVESYIMAAVDGFNATVFAYGQTGAGKTHTMAGPLHDPGIIPRAVSRIFDAIAAKPNITYTIRLSFVELHLDHFIDLLDPELSSGGRKRVGGTPAPAEKRRPKLEIHEVQNGDTKDVFLTGSDTLRTQVTSADEVMQLIERGSRMRSVSATRLNEVSSRSHTILTFQIEGVAHGSNVTQFGKLHLVDLAGSERLKKSGAEGDTQKETLNINSSLTALADVLSALSAPPSQAPAVVPYRNSKLTRLLQDSLGGNSKTFFIVNVHSSNSNFRETLMSLQYGQRAKLIKNNVVVNKEVAAVDSEQLKQLQAELDDVRHQLEEKTKELDGLRATLKNKIESNTAEETALKQKLARLSSSNDKERNNLERRMSTLQYSHTSALAEQQLAYATLQTNVDDLRKEVHGMKVKQVLDQDEIDQLREQVRDARAEVTTAEAAKAALHEEKAALEEQLREVERRAETEAGVLAKKVKELEQTLSDERKRARQAVREGKDEAGIAKAEVEERAEALQAQLSEKTEELARVRADDAKRIRQLEKQLSSAEAERDSVRKVTEELEDAKKDIAVRDKRIAKLREELEQVMKGRATEDKKEAKESKESKEKKEKREKEKEKEAPVDEIIKRRNSKKRSQEARDAEEADLWEDVALEEVTKVADKADEASKKSKKHAGDKKAKGEDETDRSKKHKKKEEQQHVDLIGLMNKKAAPTTASAPAPAPAPAPPAAAQLSPYSELPPPKKDLFRERAPLLQPSPKPAEKSKTAARAPILSPLRQATVEALREQEARKKGGKRDAEDESENQHRHTAATSKAPKPSPLTKVTNNVAAAGEPKKRKLLNDKTAFALSPSVAVAPPTAAPSKKPMSQLRELFKGSFKPPKLMAK